MNRNFGFGCMRLPMNGNVVDNVAFAEMVDYFMEKGFTYFDTAHGYLAGQSEIALKACLTDRYPRESYQLVNKLSNDYFKTEEDIRPFFQSQLELCGVEYFDYYLMHAQTATYYEKYLKCKAYEIGKELKNEGKIKHLGLSFHDKAEVLERILSEQPNIEVVQLQINYLDYEDPAIEGRKCLEVCNKYNKPVIIMEPVKGGSLVNLPDKAKKLFDDLNGGSYASYAIRYTASLKGVIMVLSGMSNMEQLKDNLSFMADFKPFTPEEFKVVEKVGEIFKSQGLISCTSCYYCTAGCPKNIAIPDLFACMNAKKQFKDWNSVWYYNINAKKGSKASDCISCKKCENVCPQHLKISELLKEVAAEFDVTE